MQKQGTSVARRIGKKPQGPYSDPVRLARSILLLPKGNEQHKLIIAFYQLVREASQEKQKFLLLSIKLTLTPEYFGYAQAFTSLSHTTQTWVVKLVDTDYVKPRQYTLLNAGYGGYPLFSEWSLAVKSALSNGKQFIEPNEKYPLLGLLDEKKYIDFVETLRHYEELYLDILNVLRRQEVIGTPSIEKVCFCDYIPVPDPDLILNTGVEKKLSLEIGNYIDTNRFMREFCFTHLSEQIQEMVFETQSAGIDSYRHVMIEARVLLDGFHNYFNTLTKRPRAVLEIPSKAIAALEQAEIPANAVNAFIKCCEVEGPEKAIERLRGEVDDALTSKEAIQRLQLFEGISTDELVELFSPENRRKLKAVINAAPEEVENWSEERAKRLEEEELERQIEAEWEEIMKTVGKTEEVSSRVLAINASETVDRIASEKIPFLVVKKVGKKKKVLGMLRPFDDQPYDENRIIPSHEGVKKPLKARRRHWLTHYNKIVVIFEPAPKT